MASGVERSAGATAPAATSTGVASERLLLAAVALGGLLAPLNSTMIAVALPDIRSEFALSHGAIAWLVSSYLITMAVAQPVAGSLGDQLGRERIFRVALVAFLAFSLGATLAPSFESLVALRTGQAVAGAALIPNGMAMLRAVVPPRRLGRVNGLFGSAMAVSAASGPLIGAALLDASSWRLLFLLNVPAVGLALLLHARLRYRDDVAVGRVEIDWAGRCTARRDAHGDHVVAGGVQRRGGRRSDGGRVCGACSSPPSRSFGGRSSGAWRWRRGGSFVDAVSRPRTATSC